ncbi:hypothetical protein, partial [Legionella fairfieldensis]|uniref:hypothetical protein n=1 Tax=Legionella fairfieldensis TaxID=45064 RepID=UPI001B80DB67
DKLCREIKGEQNPDFAQEVADLQRDVDLFCKKSRELKQQLEEQNRIIDQQISALKAESQQNEATLKARQTRLDAQQTELATQKTELDSQKTMIVEMKEREKAQQTELATQKTEIIEMKEREKVQQTELATQKNQIGFLIKMMEEVREQMKGKEKDDTPSTGPGFFN